MRPCRRSLLCRTACLIRSFSASLSLPCSRSCWLDKALIALRNINHHPGSNPLTFHVLADDHSRRAPPVWFARMIIIDEIVIYIT
jgi:hypothetical protein